MAKLTIDERVLDVDPQLTVIQAAAANGIEIPHFCWHPKLSVAGNCRMCLVEVEKMPKLAIACATQVAEGMVVRTKSDRVIKARNAVMEFLLINHPLDCPICDEAGECKLQDYAYKYSIGYSRFDEDKVHKPKRVELGPRVLLDVERCIMCSRCVRFADEVARQPVLTFTQRGTHVVLTTFPETQLDNRYSMNVVEICPVGALTSRDFRFKSRVWEMSSTDTICAGCSRGCNMNMWVRNNEILRLTPRHNEDVNSYWMCDDGRLKTFPWVNSPRRLSGPLVRKDGQLLETGWDEAIAKAATDLRLFRKGEVAAIGSPFATNEDNYAFQKVMRENLGVKLLDFVEHIVDGDEDDLLIRADKTPNARGARAVGVRPASPSEGLPAILKGISGGSIKALYVLEDNIASDPKIREVLTNLDLLIVHAHERNETTEMADVVFSASTYAEKHGTFVNFQGRVQRIRAAIATLEQDRALDGFAMSRWDKFASQNDKWGKGPRRDARPSWRIVTALGAALEAKAKFQTSEDVFREITERVPEFKGLTFMSVGIRGHMLAARQAAAKPVSVT
ncbi:MAG: NADH dehydrogenase [Ignavibacteria bacterium RIFCSPHIGHO2_02_FULL_56_12]|nr:MAG: NADH dehydrogenase [Ignavibacteria bacterium RIFCSPHIGHO2_02_FULL_56_12]